MKAAGHIPRVGPIQNQTMPSGFSLRRSVMQTERIGFEKLKLLVRQLLSMLRQAAVAPPKPRKSKMLHLRAGGLFRLRTLRPLLPRARRAVLRRGHARSAHPKVSLGSQRTRRKARPRLQSSDEAQLKWAGKDPRESDTIMASACEASIHSRHPPRLAKPNSLG